MGKQFFQGNPGRAAQTHKQQHLYRGDSNFIYDKNEYGKEQCQQQLCPWIE